MIGTDKKVIDLVFIEDKLNGKYSLDFLDVEGKEHLVTVSDSDLRAFADLEGEMDWSVDGFNGEHTNESGTVTWNRFKSWPARFGELVEKYILLNIIK